MNSHDPVTPAGEKQSGLPPVAPDFIEQDDAEQIDNIIPSRGYQMTPMVGLGGSAGSIQALLQFFKAMPPDSGLIFVVVLHLSPTHRSTLDSLLGNVTAMPVVQAEDGQKVLPNHVYVIPPAKHLATVNGHLKLSDLDQERGKRVAIDVFYRSLADTHGPHAAAIVLSGADGDGAQGIKRIKERGGLTIAQDPGQAEHPSMPKTAIDTGMVDWVLQVSEVPLRLLEYFHLGKRLKLPAEDGPQPIAAPPPAPHDQEGTLRETLAFLRTRTGHDFSYYKRATIVRRIGRRMQVNAIDDLAEYLAFLRTHPGEAGALLQDLLISVTNFFRDRDVFRTLEDYIPELFKGKSQRDTVRVWSPACATGEEAYSLAILLNEHARKLNAPPTLQIFACDLDEHAIQIARAGLYPDTISADVSEERLNRFFVKESKGYRVRRELRESVLFAAHDLLIDAPFSRMDLISCRNLLIYLNREAQQRVFETFHFALNPAGILLLGASEAVDEGSPLFRVLDKKNRIYARQAAHRVSVPVPSGPNSLLRAMEVQERSRTGPVVHGRHFLKEAGAVFHGRLAAHLQLDRVALADLHFQLIERYAAPSILVNSEHEIMHLSERAGEFLKFTGGEPTMNLLRLVQPGLRIELRTALFRAAETNVPIDSFAIPLELEGQRQLVHIRVAPAGDISPGFLLVTFTKDAAPPVQSAVDAGAGPTPAVQHLERELEQVKASLRNTVEQYEASTEELRASNEELQAMNEELKSASEELETSREELQSINEELTTVNQELKHKVDELAHTNADLQNLMASTAIATVFLDRQLAITRYTPPAVEIFNLIASDIGRPLSNLKHTLDYADLLADAAQVLRTLVPIEREIREGNRWHLARLQPYRTEEDQIAGVVLTLVEVTERNRATEALRQSEERMRLLIESARGFAIFTADRERRIDSWNSGAETMFGYSENEILGQLSDILFTPEDRAKGDPQREVRLAAEEGRAQNERWHSRKDGSIFYGSGSVFPLRDKRDELLGFVKIMRDLTESKRMQESLAQQLEELTRFNAAAVGRETRMIELKQEINELCARLGEPVRYSTTPAE